MNDQIDIALTMDFDLLELSQGTDCLSAVFQSQPKCVISKSHPLSHKDEIHLEELKTEPMIDNLPGDFPGSLPIILSILMRGLMALHQ